MKTKLERLEEALSLRKDLANHGLSPEIPAIKEFCLAISRFVNCGESETLTARLPEFPNARLQLILSKTKMSGINVLYD